MYITIQSFDKFHGPKPLVLNRLVKLVKEPNNKYDAEAISCEMRHFGKIGYLRKHCSFRYNEFRKII